MKLARIGIAMAAAAALTGVGLTAPVSAAPAPGTADIVIVKNTSGGDGIFAYTLSDDGGGTVATTSLVTSDGTGTKTMTSIKPGTYTLSEEVLPGWKVDSVQCGAASSTDNAIQVTVAADETLTCTFKNTTLISLSKQVSSGPTLVAGHSDQFDVGYTLTIINSSPTTRQISVTDALDLGAGVAVIGGPTLVSPPAALTPDTTWDGTIAHAHLGDATLSIATTLIINFTVRLQLAPGTTTAARDCTRAQGEVGTGSLNLAVLGIKRLENERVDGAVVATACAPLSTLTLKAVITNDNGGTKALSDITLTAAGGATLSGTSPVMGAAGAAAANLAGSDLAGYTKSAFVCTGGTLAGSAVTVTPGGDAVCTISYDDNPPATTTTTAATTTTASTLPPTGTRAAKASLGLGTVLLALGGLLVLLAGARRRGHA